MSDEPRQQTRRRVARGPRLALGTLVALSILTAGCSTHDVAVSNPCRTTRGGKVVAVSSRGAIAMAKVGLSPRGLKAQEQCK
jgi:hypothetical protein